MAGHKHVRWSLTFALLAGGLFAIGAARAATKAIDLDGNPANGAESQCDLNVLQTFPVMIETRVTNRAVGDSYTFSWPSAGPGGFTSSVTPGSTGGVGAKWTWTTNQSVFSFTGGSCDKDLCFAKTDGPDPITSSCNFACLADSTIVNLTRSVTAGTVVLNWTGGTSAFTVYRASNPAGVAVPGNALGTVAIQTFSDAPPASGIFYYVVRGTDCSQRKTCTTDADCRAPGDGPCVSRGPFGVPGRSLLASDVTVSAGSLTSSLITFFSPPKEVFRATSSAGGGGVSETVTNSSTSPVSVTIPAYPEGCCPADSDVPHQLRCGDTCVDYLNDPNNCGACDNVCDAGSCCSGGICASLCGDGSTWCGEDCVDLEGDNDNCGACGNTCGDDFSCTNGVCLLDCSEGQIACDGQCVDVQNDSDNCGACGTVCGDGFCCNSGACECPEGRMVCGTECIDLQNDGANCGACDHACGGGTCCSAGECVSVCQANEVWCNGACVDLQNDSGSCGTCGHACGGSTCCNHGTCVADPSVCSIPVPPGSGLGQCPNLTPTLPTSGYCKNALASHPTGGYRPNQHQTLGTIPGFCPEPGAPPSGTDSPVCTINQSTQTIPPGGSASTCIPGGVLFKEIPTSITVCGDSIPGVNGLCNNSATKITTGTFNRLVPDETKTVGNAYITPFAVHVTSDTSNDGLLEPGESADLVIDVVNAGPMTITNARADLAAPAVDLSDDGLDNPVGLWIGTEGTTPYGTILGTPASTDCTPQTPNTASNTWAFPITVPPDHPGDTSHPLTLLFTGTVNGAPFSMDVPLSLGVADACDYGANTRDFDGIAGLKPPMAALVPDGEPPPFPTHTFMPGSVRPMKLVLTCGTSELGNGTIDPPEIVALSEATRGAIDVSTLIENHTQTTTRFFVWREDLAINGNDWQYDLATANLGTGTFTITIRIAGRKDYVTGFVLN